jgi:glycosyltransferase involved in cell wall biosynthesis
MRIAIVSIWFAEKMGYSENCLPKALASLGHDVHLVTSNAQVYCDIPEYKEVYEPFIGPPLVDVGRKDWDGYKLYRLPYGGGRMALKELLRTLREIKPDIVQVLDPRLPSTFAVAVSAKSIGYKLFLLSSRHASVSAEPRGLEKIMSFIRVGIPGMIVGALSKKCYAVSEDAADIVRRHDHIPDKKIEVRSLGVDTELFYALPQEERAELRKKFNYTEDDIVCIYTGRLDKGKGPLCLAQAIDKLVDDGFSYKGLFVGMGPQQKDIENCKGCRVHPFVPFREVPPFYQLADIGVWPRQESTSQLDAAASGLPIVISNNVTVRERVEGNGLFYEEGNSGSLADALLKLRDPALRKELGLRGAEKIKNNYSWLSLAQKYVDDYQ